MLRRLSVVCIGALGVGACDRPWNDPHSGSSAESVVLYSAFDARPKHLDPARSYSSDEYRFIAQVYEPPLQYHYLKRPYALEPLVAVEMPVKRYYDTGGRELEPDAGRDEIATTVYEIEIKAGVLYQPHPMFAYPDLSDIDLDNVYSLQDFPETGTRELIAADYVHQLKRLADPAVQSPIYGLMAQYIVGLNELNARITALGTREPGDLEKLDFQGAEVVDRYRYRIRLKGDYPQFLYWLAMPFFAPMPPEAERFYAQETLSARNITLDWYPVGTGPYYLAENNPNRQMVLERNPYFRGESHPLDPDGPEMPQISKAIYKLDRESIPRWSKFLQGYYDHASIGSDTFDQALQVGVGGSLGLTDQMQQRGVGLSATVAATSYYIGFNWLDPVVGGDNERARLLRQAISMAIDFDEFVEIFRNGRGTVAQGPIPPGLFGFRAGEDGMNSLVYVWDDGKAVRRPIEAARELLNRAGYENGVDPATGKPLLLYYEAVGGGDPDAKARFAWLVKQFRKLGIQLVVRATDYNRFRDKMSAGAGQMFLWGWNADYPDPENFLFLLHSGQGKARYKGENAANYSNPEFDALFERMKAMLNTPERQAIIDRMVEIVRHDSPWIWGFHPKDYSLNHAWISGNRPNAMVNNSLKYLRLDPKRREAAQADWNRPVIWPLWALLSLLLAGSVAAAWAWRRRRDGVAGVRE